MAELNTDMTDLSDVTDEAIEAALRAAGWNWIPSTQSVRGDPSGYRGIVLLARAIQANYPEMIVDPVTVKARELAGRWGFNPFLTSSGSAVDFAKAAIMAGMAMERGE